MTTPLDIKTVIALNEESVFRYVYSQLSSVYSLSAMKWGGKDYVVFEGSNPITLVAHIDTLMRVTINIKQKCNVIYNPNAVLGADCRAGVYGLIKIAQKCKKKGIELPTLIFTNGEERGGTGVKTLIRDNVLDVKKTRLFVELDRKGSTEYVFYSWTLPKAVKKYVESYGYTKADGSYSDISDLTAKYEIPAVNLSIGYYNQHTAHEKLHVDEMELTINRVIKMLQNPIPQLHVCKDEWKDDIGYWDNWESRKYGNYTKGGASDWYWDKETNACRKKSQPSYYDYDADKRKAYDEEYKSSDNYYLGYNGGYGAPSSWVDKKYELRRELIQTGYVYSVFNDVSDADFDAITDLESVFQDYAPLFPDDLERAFDIAWTDTMNRYDAGEYDSEEEADAIEYAEYSAISTE